MFGDHYIGTSLEHEGEETWCDIVVPWWYALGVRLKFWVGVYVEKCISLLDRLMGCDGETS